MSMYQPNGSRIYCKNPADYAKIAEKILAREPLVITLSKDGVMTEGILWDPDDQERLQVLMSYVPPKKPKLWRKLVSQVCRAKAGELPNSPRFLAPNKFPEMAATARYLTHPQVEIDPSIPVTAWRLNALGHQRVRSALTAGWLSRTSRIVSSAERKAIETATPLANALGIPIQIREGMHENDRSSTGFLPPIEFEKVANEFFGHPQTSVRGWETALAAQARIVREVEKVLDGPTSGDLLLVGHGAVGTLLLCHYAKLAISRAHDQPSGGGQCFAFSLRDRRLIHSWRPMEDLDLACTASDNLC